jgi:hypothetical protein
MLLKANIIFFYAEVMPYTIACLKEINTRIHGVIDVVYWDGNNLTPFLPERNLQIRFHPRSSFTNKASFQDFIKDKNLV